MFSIGSNQSSKRWELLSIAGCEGLGLLITFFMAWSPARHQRRVIRGWSPRRLRHLQFLPTQRRDQAKGDKPVFARGQIAFRHSAPHRTLGWGGYHGRA